jgi:hypothetical protein
MPLSLQEQQLYDLLNAKLGVGMQSPPTALSPPQAVAPVAPVAQSIDMDALAKYIDQKVEEKVAAKQQHSPLAQYAQNQIPIKDSSERQMDKLVQPERILLERLRPLILRAMTFEQKGRFAELAMNVRLGARSKEEAYRVGIDAFCDFLNTNTGREWIQIGAASFLGSMDSALAAQQADVPSKVNVNPN